MKLEPRISLITLGVADVAASTTFYERLGWKRSGASQQEVSFFVLNGVTLALFGRSALAGDAGVENSHPAFGGITLAHNLRSEAEVDEAFQFALDCGAKSVRQPEKVYWGGYRGYFADVDGHLWELAYNPGMPLDPQGNMILPD